MKNTIPIFVFLLVFHLSNSAQVVVVRDLVSGQPLEYVTIRNLADNQFVATDSKGRADVSAFAGAAHIEFRLLGYASLTISYDQLKAKQYRIELDPTGIILDEAVISATRWKEERKDIAQQVSVIPIREALLQQPQTAADLLGNAGGVLIQKSQYGGGSPMIRGFATNRVLISVDGVRMNNAIFRSGNLHNVISLDPFSIESTEVLYGPGAVMYGSDAIGGAMCFYTLEPKTSKDKPLLLKTNAVVRYSTASSEKTGHIDFSAGLKKWGFVTSATYSDFGDLRMGSYGPDEYLRTHYQIRINNRDTIVRNPDSLVQVKSGYSQLNVMQKARFVHQNLSLEYGFHYSASSDIPRYDRLIERAANGNFRDGEWYYGPQIWNMHVLNASLKSSNPVFDQMRAIVAWQHFEESRHNRSFRSFRRTDRTEKVEAYSVNLDFEKKNSGKTRISYGTEAILNTVDSKAQQVHIVTGKINPTSTRYPDGSQWASLAGYLTYTNRISNKLTFLTGLRYSHIFVNAEFDTTFFKFPFTSAKLNNAALTGNAGLVYRPSAPWQMTINLATGFRAPNIDDIGKVFDSEPGSVVVPNPDLKPEYAWSAEAGITRVAGYLAKFDAAVYYTWLDNALVRRNFMFNGFDSIMYDGRLSRVQAIQNASSAYLLGWFIGMEFKLPYGFGVSSRFTYQKGEEELEDMTLAPLRHTVPWYGSAHLTYVRNRIRADLYSIFNSSVPFDQLAPSERAKPHQYAKDDEGNPYSPSWMTLNFKFQIQAMKYLAVYGGVENILDVRYRTYSSGIAAPGRNFIISLRASL